MDNIPTDSRQFIIVKGARQHNLKNIDVAFKRNKFTVVTGVSGSGKSSLVFDTLYAEGQRRYVESLSAYVRQFMGKMNKPDVDYIKGIAPAIAIEQKVITRNPRSTVATTTEIHDYLKLLFAKAGKTFSPLSGEVVKKHNQDDVVSDLQKLPIGSVALICCLLPENATLRESLQKSLEKGFSRLLLKNEILKIEVLLEKSETELKKIKKNRLNIIIDRVIIDPQDEELNSRIADSAETALVEGEGKCDVFLALDSGIMAFNSYSSSFDADGMHFEEPTVNLFSFNNPYGACKKCEGFGSVLGIDSDLVVPDKSLSVADGAVAPWRSETMNSWKTDFIRSAFKYDFPVYRSYYDLNEAEKDLLWNGNAQVNGINQFFTSVEQNVYKIQYRVMLSKYRGKTTCPDCKGTRLRPDANYVKLVSADSRIKLSISDILLMSVNDASNTLTQIELSNNDKLIAERPFKEIINRLQFLKNVGLGYLSLNRLSNTLSGGESQRINLATSLGSSLVGSMYILDEPSIGLHSKDTENLIRVLLHLKNLGNTLIVVEHDEEVMLAADEIIDIGPEAGVNGGHLVFQGKFDEMLGQDSLTAAYLTGKKTIETPKTRRQWNQSIEIVGAREHNLKGLNVSIPLNTITVVSGVSGSGKTTLIKNILYPALQKALGNYSGTRTGSFEKLSGNIRAIKQVELIDQNPIGKSSRSNPVTYIKAYDAIRELFAEQIQSKHAGLKPQHFSFNVDGGRCDNCKGEGETIVEMQFMADLHLLCEACSGKRFKNEVLEVTYRNKNIYEVLCLTVTEALEFFKDQKIILNKLNALEDVGLGYISLGQSSSTLSGGEAQRIKLASFLVKGNTSDKTLFIFDEPTTGLHFHDIKKLLGAFNALVLQGHSLVVIEHNLDVIKYADWVIDLGPEGGDKGGELIFAGTPEDLAANTRSVTAKYLRKKLFHKVG